MSEEGGAAATKNGGGEEKAEEEGVYGSGSPSPSRQRRRSSALASSIAKNRASLAAFAAAQTVAVGGEGRGDGGYEVAAPPPPLAAVDEEEDAAAAAAARPARRSSAVDALAHRLSVRIDPAILEAEEADREAVRTDSQRRKTIRDIGRRLSVFQRKTTHRLVEVRLRDFTYNVPVKWDAPSKKTVLNQSVCYYTYEVFRRLYRYWKRELEFSDFHTPFTKKPILKDINLVLKPGRSYLILGPPSCGKTSLLKAIAGMLPHSSATNGKGEPSKRKPDIQGRVEFNGVTVEDDPGLVLANIVSFVGQLDNHAPFLTVRETFEFAFQCRTGGKHAHFGCDGSSTAINLDKENFTENMTIEGLDLAQCADTFVGDANIRGVSGGQRRRVTIGEMMQGQNPVACGDEISTGLDAAVTYDIVHSIVAFAKAAQTTRIVSLLQPGPETFALFDEVILLSEGNIIYAGPIDEVVDYFSALGYEQPPTMDVADFLQSIPTPDGSLMFDPSKSPADAHMGTEEFVEAFKASAQYASIMGQLNSSSPYQWAPAHRNDKGQEGDEEIGKAGGKTAKQIPEEFKSLFQNSFVRAMKLNLHRHYTLWKRDWGFIIGKMFENIGMAFATGGILFGQAKIPPLDPPETVEDVQKVSDSYYKLMAAVFGALFMTSLHILLGTMTSAPDEIDGRAIHYKHYDSRFYQSYSFVFGRLISTFPQRALEIVSFGIPLYWMVGLNPTAGAFFTYLVLLICYTIGLKMLFGILAQTLPKKANVQSVGTFLVLLLSLFGGFIVYPGSIPDYYIWIYWANPMAWALQGLSSNEFMSSKYGNIFSIVSGSRLLSVRGFQTGREWIGYSFAYMIPFTLIVSAVLGIALKYVRIQPERSNREKNEIITIGECVESDEEFNLPFTPVDLTFDKLVYEVKASTGNETLRLLNEVTGVFMAGRMCALMGSSGAGKTTLMDVIAMRKTSGNITGEIRLNGFLQERTSFLRCSGYVEQFDVQQPELTVRETVAFCACLRLDASQPEIGDDAGKMRYVTHVLKTMELTDIQNLQVGSYEEGGLTFEQRKRLAIACELAGSPSVLFLDEPTSGLDSRGALVVMRAMKRIADTGRTVCATIHQPSSAVFEMFDDLILLKRGGNVVFFGELGTESVKLIEYFEARGATPIEFGENPAAWMLRAYAGDGASEDVDWAELFKSSDQCEKLRNQIEAIKESPDESKKISFESTFPTSLRERSKLTTSRIVTIYKRSPAYNLARLMIAVFYAFILGSVFLHKDGRSDTWEENEVEGVLGTMFLGLIIIGVTSISMAVPVMKRIRDVFYKHRASGMLTNQSVSWALLVGETPYICLISVLFGAVYYGTVQLFKTAERFLYFWVFFTLNVAIYSYFGQAFICLVRDVATSGALVGALVGYNIFFSGFVVKPQYFQGPFQLGLWTAPGRFAYEGLVITQFYDIETSVQAQPYSPFFFNRICSNVTANDDFCCDLGVPEKPCGGTMEQYVEFAFGGKFKEDDFWLDVGVLLGYLVLARVLTGFALGKFNYVNT